MSTSWRIIFLLAFLVNACTISYRIWYGYSPDRLHRVEVLKRGGRQQLRVDQEWPREYLGVALETILFSKDSQRLAYAAKTDTGWIMVVDSVASRSWTGIGEGLFGPGQQFAYVVEDAGGWRVVLENNASASFEAVMQGSLTFSPDGGRLAFVVAEGDGFRVVVDNEPGPIYQAIGALRFDSEGKRLAYVARSSGQQYLVVNDLLLGPFRVLADFTLGPKGRLGMLVRGDDGWRAVIDGQESDAFDNLSAIHFSKNGRYAYAAQCDSSWFVVLEGERSPTYYNVRELVFAQEQLIYRAYLGKNNFVVVDGIRGPYLKWVGQLVVSAEGFHLAYLGQPWGGNLSVFHDHTVSAMPQALDGTLVLSNDGRHWACLAVNQAGKGLDIIVDGKFRHSFALEEIIARFMLTSDVPQKQYEKMLRRWVKATLEAAFSNISGQQNPLKP